MEGDLVCSSLVELGICDFWVFFCGCKEFLVVNEKILFSFIVFLV